VKGTLEQAGPRWRLRFIRELDHPVPRVWQAVTEPAHLEAWFPQRVTGDWVAGTPLIFSDPQGRGPDFAAASAGYVSSFGPDASAMGVPPGYEPADS
jgi:hypothetical protein